MNTGPRHNELMLPFLGQAVVLCCLSAVFTLAVAVVYGMLSSVWHGHVLGIAGFVPSGNAWEASVLLGLAVALFQTTGDSVEIDCDQGRRRLSAVTYSLALATTCLFGLALERVSHGTWLQPYFQSWLGAAVVAAFLATKLLALRWHRKALLSQSVQ